MESFAFIRLLLHLLLLIGHGLASQKRRLCIDFEMDHKRAQHDVLSANLCLSKRQCMMKCAADARCTAFNFRSGDGFCELLLALPECYEPGNDDDFIFTQLKLPNFQPPMAKQSKPLATSDLQWRPCNSTTAISSSNIQVTNNRHVALGFNKGMYLPGYFTPRGNINEIKMFYPPDDANARCDHGYLLSVQHPEQYQWVFYQPGYPIPSGSLSAGSHVDGTPLYIIQIICGTGKRSGFYSSSFERPYVYCNSPINLNSEMEILVYEFWYNM